MKDIGKQFMIGEGMNDREIEKRMELYDFEESFGERMAEYKLEKIAKNIFEALKRRGEKECLSCRDYGEQSCALIAYPYVCEEVGLVFENYFRMKWEIDRSVKLKKFTRNNNLAKIGEIKRWVKE